MFKVEFEKIKKVLNAEELELFDAFKDKFGLREKNKQKLEYDVKCSLNAFNRHIEKLKTPGYSGEQYDLFLEGAISNIEALKRACITYREFIR